MVYLIGASGHAEVIIEILEKLKVSIGGLQDSNPDLTSLLGYTIHEKFPNSFNPNEDRVIIAIGNNKIRKRIVLSQNYKFAKAIYPLANISIRTIIGEGTVVMAGVSINSSCKIGNHVIINTNSSIDHNCVLEDYVHVSPNAALAGNVHIGEGSHIGIGVCVIQGITIGKWCTIGAGAVIIKDVPDGVTVVGNPGRIIKLKEIK